MSKKQSIKSPRGINRIGQVFGRLKVTDYAGVSRHGENLWRCQCECGEVIDTLGSSLRKGKTKSCGCLMRELGAQRHHKHGHHQDATYRVWAGMVQRCTNRNLPHWKDYGGRGVKLHPPWREFANFLADMGERPGPEYSIDRFPDNNGNYEPGNCRWATARQQQRNKRTSRSLTWNGKTQCVTDWADEIGVTTGALFYRLRRGWSVGRALTTPLRVRP